MKFDLIISNPPYNMGLDLKILSDVYEFGEKICFVHPATWLTDKKGKSKLYSDIKTQIKNSFEFYEIVNEANDLFNINNFTDIYITLFNKKTKLNIDISGITKYNFEANLIIKKILSYCDKSNILNKATLENNLSNYGVAISPIRGNVGNIDFYTIIQKTNENKHLGFNNNYAIKWNFNNENIAINFKEYLKLKIVRFCLSIFKNNGNLVNRKNNIKSGAIASVPYMPSYERPWTDEDVAKELELTEEELAWAINWIPDYYPEDAEKYAKWKDYKFTPELIEEQKNI